MKTVGREDGEFWGLYAGRCLVMWLLIRGRELAKYLEDLCDRAWGCAIEAVTGYRMCVCYWCGVVSSRLQMVARLW